MRVTPAGRQTLLGMEYRIVNPAEWIERARPLLAAHWREVDPGFELAPCAALYQRMHEAGLIFAVAVLDGAELAGYASITVAPSPHNPAVVLGMSDALFVPPSRRCGVVPGRLIAAAEAEAKRRGASRFIWACRTGTPLAEMLGRHGYSPLEQHVMKEL